MRTILKKLLSVTAIIFPVFCFGTITRESFFRVHQELPNQKPETEGSFFSGFIFPFNYQHSKFSYLENSTAGIIMQFKDPTLSKKNSVQTNKWILRLPIPNFQVHELEGHFNFDIDSNNILTVELKELESINLNDKEICNHSPSLKSVPIFSKLAKIHTVAFAKIDLTDNIFEKNIILINPLKEEFYKQEQYLKEDGFNVQKFKEIFYQKTETHAIANRLPDDSNQYIIGFIEVPKKDSLEDKPKHKALKNIDFIYLKYRPGVSPDYRRY